METPTKTFVRPAQDNVGTPLRLPATPFLQKLGYGTGKFKIWMYHLKQLL